MRKILFLLVMLCSVVSGVHAEKLITSTLPAKNLVWIIADGMGPELMGFLMEGARSGVMRDYKKDVSAMEHLIRDGEQGLFFNNTQDTIVTDSAAAATQMATGRWSLPGYIGVDYQGNSAENLLELAKQKGKAIGVVSDAYVTDATPAGFTAHAQNRRDKTEIARQQLVLEPEVILGGGKKYFSGENNENLLAKAAEQGYQVVFDKKSLAKVHRGRVLGLFADKGMPMAVETYAYPKTPDLTEMTQKALELLAQDEDGFVLIVEAGKLDWAAHANDAGATLAELKLLDKVIASVRKFADKHPETLMYLNADHDTGLGAFVYQNLDNAGVARKTQQGEVLYKGDVFYGNSATYAKLEKQRRSLYLVEQEMKKLPAEKLTPAFVQKQLSRALGYQVDISEFENLTDVHGLFKQINEQYGFAWATQAHASSVLIGVAYGPGQEQFKGVYHNTEILPKLKNILNFNED